jgi:pyridoxamine 5'-phosphate oxidase
MDQNLNIAEIRKDYTLLELSIEKLAKNPIEQFQIWFQQAIAAQVNEPNAMTLATVNNAGMPNARIVLLKGIENNSFIYFTNYNSQKGRELAENPNAALVFFWPELQRQVRIEGQVKKISNEASIAYFNSRPIESQIGAIVSPQSQKIADRTVLENAFTNIKNNLNNTPLEKPEHWGGYALSPQKIEFWQGRASRLHDRFCFELHAENWELTRLAP